MPRTSRSQRHQARRALLDDVRDHRRSWVQHGIAALGVSVLGLGVAGTVWMTGATQDTAASTRTHTAAVATTDRDAAAGRTSRGSGRAALDPAKVKSLADQRAEELAKTDDLITAAASGRKVDEREKELAATSDRATSSARKLAAKDRTASDSSGSTDAAADDNGKTCLPAEHYHVAARFGQVGVWARYHTGFDFAAPIGTTLRAPSAGVVTNAGRGPASAWAGNYVVIRYPDGTQSLMAHMSSVSVHVGQSVSGCSVVGAIGMTGRAFGPHVHFEIYPAGIEPGDLYKAVNPVPWLKAHHLNP